MALKLKLNRTGMKNYRSSIKLFLKNALLFCFVFLIRFLYQKIDSFMKTLLRLKPLIFLILYNITLKWRHTAVGDIDLYGTKLKASFSKVFKTSLTFSGWFYIGRNVIVAVDITWKRNPCSSKLKTQCINIGRARILPILF